MKKTLLVIVGILFAFSANAITIPEGAVIKTANNPDVYIVKYKNGKQFKRLVLNPQVFESYGHLRWEDILTITQTEMNSFTESTLVRSYGENNVYKLVANGDSGDKALVDSNYTYDPDSVYTINKTDSGNYFLKKLSDLAGKFNDIKLKVASPKIDFCNNIEGAQISLPAGMYRDNGNCYTKVVVPESTTPQNDTQATEDLKRTTISVQALKQLTVLTNEANNELDILYKQLEIKKYEIDNVAGQGRGLTTSYVNAKIAKLTIEYNALVGPYNTKLEYYKKMLSMTYVIEDYRNNIYISVSDRTFLGSLGINL
ncbi:MAG: hypothetical protein KAQ64_05175 [Candidatus Pacebacteria bacterium]|nr:hypothetical protein [Candidatus Paceibacterota bacterium]